MVKLSIVILTRNRLDCLKDTIKCVKANVINSYEIIVVNNNSTDGTTEYLNSLNDVKSINLYENDGVWARNHGMKVAMGEFIAQIDDDVHVFPEWDSVMLEQFVDEKVIAVGQCSTNITGWMEWDSEGIRAGDYVDNVTGFCWMFRNKGFLYDKFFMKKSWHDETDLQLQMIKAGYKIRVCNTVCNHLSLRKGVNWEEHNECQAYLINKWKPKWENKEFELIGMPR